MFTQILELYIFDNMGILLYLLSNLNSNGKVKKYRIKYFERKTWIFYFQRDSDN